MGRAGSSPGVRLETLERELGRLRKEFLALGRRLGADEERIRRLARAADGLSRNQSVLSEALHLDERAKKGDRGVIGDLDDSIIRLEGYLIKTSERIENILSALKRHRELLVSMNKRVVDTGTKDRIRLELDVMKNTLSVLALNGIELDMGLVKDIEKLRASVPEAKNHAELEKSKAHLDKKFDDELRKFDLDAIWSKRKEIPGYR